MSDHFSCCKLGFIWANILATVGVNVQLQFNCIGDDKTADQNQFVFVELKSSCLGDGVLYL